MGRTSEGALSRTEYQLTDITLVALVILAGSAILGFGLSIRWAVSSRRILNFPTLLLVNYSVAYLGSGVAHLISSSSTSRGYYNAFYASAHILPAAALCAAGLGAIWVGLTVGGTSKSKAIAGGGEILGRNLASPLPLTRREKRFAATAIALLLPIGLFAAWQIQGYSALVDSARIISLPQGIARFSILSQWLVWVISFIAIWILSVRRQFTTMVIVTGMSMVGIFAVMSWTGGRSVALVLGLPLLAVLLPRFGRGWIVIVCLGGAALLQFVIAVSSARSLSQTPGSPLEWLDWQWGRWSMVVYALSRQGEGEYPGSTLIANLLAAMSGILRLVGINVDPGYSMSAVAGSDLLGRADLTYIVPGIGAELIYNFGFIGYLVGFAIVGYAVARVDRAFANSENQLTALAWAYVGTLFTLRLVITDAGGMFSYLVIGGLPLLAGAWVARRRARISSHSPTLRKATTPS
jgi:hypothetical protein